MVWVPFFGQYLCFFINWYLILRWQGQKQFDFLHTLFLSQKGDNIFMSIWLLLWEDKLGFKGSNLCCLSLLRPFWRIFSERVGWRETMVCKNHCLAFSIYIFLLYLIPIHHHSFLGTFESNNETRIRYDEYNSIIMINPYEKILKRSEDKEARKNINKPHLHMISFDDSDESSRQDIPNIFLDERENSYQPYSPPKPPKKGKVPPRVTAPVLEKSDSAQHIDFSRSPTKRIVMDVDNQPQPEPEQIAEPEQDIHPNSSLSMVEILKLNLGQFLFRNRYPLKKTIYINNNNEEENELNQKEYELKNQQEKDYLHFDNSLATSTAIYTFALLFRNTLGQLWVWTWLLVIILQFLTEGLFIKMPMQYSHDKASLIVLLMLAMTVQVVADWLTFRKRRQWKEPEQAYRLYHHNGHLAEFVNTQAKEIKAGNIFKVQPGQQFPTDSILIYSERSLVKVDETAVISQLVEHPSPVTIKETVVRAENIPLPLSGYLLYEIGSPEHTDFQIVGKLNLEEPNKNTHEVSMSNIVLRGCRNVSEIEVIAMAMETGIDSLLLKGLQYPYSQRHQHEYSTQLKRKQISDKASEEIQNYENTFAGLPLENKIQLVVVLMLVLYAFLTVFGILVSFCYSMTTSNEFFMPSGNIPIWKIFLYHSTNFIILLPVTFLPLFRLFIAVSGAVTEYNLSKRQLVISSQRQRIKRDKSLMESASSKVEELLDHKKIIYPVSIKDYNVLTELSKVDTIVTTLDTFRDHSAFTLHSIKFKQIQHNFMTNTLDNQAYSVEDIQQMKYFMSVALLTTTRNEHLSDSQEPSNYDSCIQQASRRHFDLQKKRMPRDQIRIGSEFAVKEMFHIDPVYEHPYKVVFLDPVASQSDKPVKQYELPDDSENNQKASHMQSKEKNVLVLIRGNPKVILDKCYGKSVGFTEQSRRLEEQKGYHVELLAKLTLHHLDAAEIRNAYQSHSMDKSLFYKNLDKYISKVESMGLLVFVNQFHQKKIGESLKNPILNKSILNQHQIKQSQPGDHLTAKMMPNIIILAPWSQSSQPQFESIHTITNLLISPYLFHLSLSQVGDKIYHQRPADLDRMFTKLQDEKVIVWNNWDQRDICYTLEVLKQYGSNVLFYSQKDEYLFVSKQVNCSVKGGPSGYDGDKYSDISLASRCSISYLYLLQMIKYDSVLIRQALISMLFTQIGKFVLYFVVQLVNLFYTRGSGLMVFKTPLFFVVEVVLFLDVLYYINWNDSGRAHSFNGRRTYLREVGLKIVEKTLQGLFVTFITIYSTQTPSGSDGTPHPYHYTYFTIVFTLLHILVLQKLFSLSIQAASINKAVVILGQILIIYISFIVVSVLDKYHYRGIAWNALKAGNVWVTFLGCLWMCLTVPAGRWLWNVLRSRKLRTGHSSKLL